MNRNVIELTTMALALALIVFVVESGLLDSILR